MQPRICLLDSLSECHVSRLTKVLSDTADGTKKTCNRKSSLPSPPQTDYSQGITDKSSLAEWWYFHMHVRNQDSQDFSASSAFFYVVQKVATDHGAARLQRNNAPLFDTIYNL